MDILLLIDLLDSSSEDDSDFEYHVQLALANSRYPRMVNTTCAVHGCKSSSRTKKDVRFHRFPSDERFDAWVEACQRPDLRKKSKDQLRNVYVCSLHFEKWMYRNKVLKSGAMPKVNLPCLSNKTVSTQTPGEEPKARERCALYNREVQTDVNMVDITTHVQTLKNLANQSTSPAQVIDDLAELRAPQQDVNVKLELEEDQCDWSSTLQASEEPSNYRLSNEASRPKKRRLDSSYVEQTEQDEQLTEFEQEIPIKIEQDDQTTSTDPLGEATSDSSHEFFGSYVASLMRNLSPENASQMQSKIISLFTSNLKNENSENEES